MIRKLESKDIPRCLELGRMMHAESQYGFLEFSSKKASGLLFRSTHDKDSFGAVVEAEGAIVGFCLGYVTEYFFCEEKIAQDYVVYIEKSFRGSKLGIALIRGFVEWAKTKGVREVCMGITTGVHTEKTKMVYETLGFAEAGNVMKMRIS